MNIYFDTEFTGLHKDTTLISIGCVAQNGAIFYAEFLDYDKEQCDSWINKNVIANLSLPVPIGNEEPYYEAIRRVTNPVPNDLYKGYDCIMNGDKKQIKEELLRWLEQFDDAIQFVSDVCHYDFVLLVDIFGNAFNLPEFVNPSCHDINQDIARYHSISDFDAFDMCREDFIDSHGMFVDVDPLVPNSKHNALYDAKVIKLIYEIINEGR